MNIERMTRLRNYLRDNVRDEKFNLGTWVGTVTKPWKGLQDLSCGTVACAMGHAASIPEFQAAGLSLKPTYEGSVRGTLVYNGLEDFDAAVAFLDIPMSVAVMLFDPESYEDGSHTSRDEVVDNITEYLKS